jgi:hypothetical protein
VNGISQRVGYFIYGSEKWIVSKSPEGDIAPAGFAAVLLVTNCGAISEPVCGTNQVNSPYRYKKTRQRAGYFIYGSEKWIVSTSPEGDIAPAGFAAVLLVANCGAISEPVRGTNQVNSPYRYKKTRQRAGSFIYGSEKWI